MSNGIGQGQGSIETGSEAKRLGTPPAGRGVTETEALASARERLRLLIESTSARSRDMTGLYAVGQTLQAIQTATIGMIHASGWAKDALGDLEYVEKCLGMQAAGLEIARKVQAETSELLSRAMRDVERMREAGDALRDIYIRTCGNSCMAPDMVRLKRWDEAKGAAGTDDPLHEQIRNVVRILASSTNMSPEKIEEMAERVIKVIEHER